MIVLFWEEDYKGILGVFKEADKVTSATNEMLNLHRITYKACKKFSDCVSKCLIFQKSLYEMAILVCQMFKSIVETLFCAAIAFL